MAKGLVSAIRLIIHPIWVIEEYDIIVRKWDWLIPINPPIIALTAERESIIYVRELVNVNLMIIKGASFCHVDRISAAIHEIDVITEGYHMWHGAIPILRIKAINKIIDINWLGMLE